ncbi:hypothetical protein ACM66B_002862 [Microbotryomycetes sp. NB124-2]
MALQLPTEPPPLTLSEAVGSSRDANHTAPLPPQQRWHGDDDRTQLPATATTDDELPDTERTNLRETISEGTSSSQASTDAEHNDEIRPLQAHNGTSTLYNAPTSTTDRSQLDMQAAKRKKKRRRRASVVRQASTVDLSESSSGCAGIEDDQAYLGGHKRALWETRLGAHDSTTRRTSFSGRGRSPSKNRAAESLSTTNGAAMLHAPNGTTQSDPQSLSSNGKGKAKEAPKYRLPASQDPFDPLSSVRASSVLPPSSSTASSFTNPDLATRALSPSVSDRRGPPTAASYPSTDSLASSSQFSSSGPSSTAYGSQNGGQQPSLQQLLQTVDLGAALKLVQTLQTQQQPLHGHPQQLQSATSMQTISQTASPSPPRLSISTSLPTNLQRQADIESMQRAPFSGGFTSALSPIPASAAEEVTPITPHTASSEHGQQQHVQQQTKSGKKQRPLSVAFGLGRKNSSKRKRSSPTAATFSPSGSRAPERVPDERATMGEFARSFEERISRVHLSLSPATLRRSQNCARYLSMRYTPLFDALAEGKQPPNLLAVSRWRERKGEQDRLSRRNTVGYAGGTQHAAPGTAGSPRPSGISSGSDVPEVTNSTSSYGPRRNKFPKAWELYPDDIAQFEQAKRDATPDSLSQDLTSPFRFSALARQSTETSEPALKATPLDSSDKATSSPSRSPQSHPDRALYSPPPMRPQNLRHESFERSPLSQLVNSYDFEPASSVSPNSHGQSRLGRIVTNMPSAADHEAAAEARKRLASGYSSSRVASAATSRDDLHGGLEHSKDAFKDGQQLSADRESSPWASFAGSSQYARSLTHNSANLTNKSTLSRQIEKLRGKTHPLSPSVDAAAADQANPRRTSGQASSHAIVTDPSESETGGFSPRTPSSYGPRHKPAATVANGRRMTSADISHLARGYDSEGLRSSGEELSPATSASGIGLGRAVRRRGGQSRRLLAAAWQGLQKTLDAYPGFDDSPNFGHPGLHPIPVHKPVRVCPDAIAEDESDEDGACLMRPQREVLDIGDDEHDKLNGALRRRRSELSHIDSVYEQAPVIVDDKLTRLTHYADHMTSTFGIAVDFAFPRLHASVLGEIARVKTSHLQARIEERDERDSGSESDTESSSEETSGGEQLRTRPTKSIARRPRRQSSFNVEPLRKVVRRPSADLGHLKPGLLTRPRSQTTSIAFGASLARPRQPSLANVQANSNETDRLNHFVLLERAIEEMSKLTRGIDEDAEHVIEKQRNVDREISSVVQSLDKVQKSIDDYYFHKLRMLEDHYFRLQQSRSRPSATIDALWTVLAGALAVIFWVFWLVITTLRMIRAIVLFPLRIIKWLFLLS